jgi:hypothetical protein
MFHSLTEKVSNLEAQAHAVSDKVQGYTEQVRLERIVTPPDYDRYRKGCETDGMTLFFPDDTVLMTVGRFGIQWKRNPRGAHSFDGELADLRAATNVMCAPLMYEGHTTCRDPLDEDVFREITHPNTGVRFVAMRPIYRDYSFVMVWTEGSLLQAGAKLLMEHPHSIKEACIPHLTKTDAVPESILAYPTTGHDLPTSFAGRFPLLWEHIIAHVDEAPCVKHICPDCVSWSSDSVDCCLYARLARGDLAKHFEGMPDTHEQFLRMVRSRTTFSELQRSATLKSLKSL